MKIRLVLLPLALLLFLGLQSAQGQDNLFQQGKAFFETEGNCIDCHLLNGKGLPGSFPALDGNRFVTGKPGPVIATVLKGRRLRGLKSVVTPPMVR